jgi:hypothetical protein
VAMAKLGTWVATVCNGDGWLSGSWVAKLVARLLAAAALWVRIQTALKNKNGRHKQRSGHHILARQAFAL